MQMAKIDSSCITGIALPAPTAYLFHQIFWVVGGSCVKILPRIMHLVSSTFSKLGDVSHFKR